MGISDFANTAIVDYNSWIESDEGRKLTSTLDKDVVLAEGELIPATRQTYGQREANHIEQATSNTRPVASTWHAWATGARTRTRKFNSMALVE